MKVRKEAVEPYLSLESAVIPTGRVELRVFPSSSRFLGVKGRQCNNVTAR